MAALRAGCDRKARWPKNTAIPTPVRIELPLPLAQIPGGKSLSILNLMRPVRWTPHRLVKRSERTVLADLQTPISIAMLCRTLGVNDRYLRRVYERVHGTPPLQYLRMLKLSRARQALMSVRGPSVTVTKIANRLGFRELGRFSVDYRKMFGESPSATLRKALRKHERKRSAH
jgi:AraC-like DNA-binding protein